MVSPTRGLILLAVMAVAGQALAQPRVVSKGSRWTEQRGHVTFSYTYPQLRGMEDRRLQSGVNAELERAFKPQSLRDTLAPPDDHYDEFRDYRVGRLDRHYLSIRYTGWSHFRGSSSHPHLAAGRTVDLRTGRVLQLSDLFKPGSAYMTRLKQLAEPIVRQQIQTDPGPRFLHTAPSFYLTPRKLVLFNVFDDQTDMDVPLDKAKLEDIAVPDGPLGKDSSPDK